MMTSKHYTLLIPADLTGERLDKALSNLLPDISRSRLQTLLSLGQVTFDGPAGTKPVSDGALKVASGQIYTVIVPEIEPSEIVAQDITLDIVYEDAHLLVINKAVGMTVHPAPGSPDQTLVNALLAHCGESLSGIGGVARPGIVHRIDKDTSGLLAVAKHDIAHRALSEQLAERTLSRTYLALAKGALTPLVGSLSGNIARHPRDRKRMSVHEDAGKHAITHYKTKERFGEDASLLECKLETGRTHQIRVHFAHVGHGLVGDPVYGGRTRRGTPSQRLLAEFPRQALHAWKLGFIHPESKKEVEFKAPLPSDMATLLDQLRAHC